MAIAEALRLKNPKIGRGYSRTPGDCAQKKRKHSSQFQPDFIGNSPANDSKQFEEGKLYAN
jgi:hypothetical protein